MTAKYVQCSMDREAKQTWIKSEAYELQEFPSGLIQFNLMLSLTSVFFF